MLETPEERIKLLKAGFTSEAIERLYIEGNNIKIIRAPPVVELFEFDISQSKKTCTSPEPAAEYA